MKAMAPGKSVALREGHLFGAGIGVRGAGVADGGAATATEERAATRPLPAGEAAAATGPRAGAPPTQMAFLQPGQITCFPAAVSGTCMAWLQNGQRINCALRASFQSYQAFSPRIPPPSNRGHP